MKKEIEEMITLLESGRYEEESAHGYYDGLLEKFIMNYDPELQPLMIKLIAIKKHFWYA